MSRRYLDRFQMPAALFRWTALRILPYSFAYRHIKSVEVPMMTAEQKSDIISLRSEGLTYSEIADRLELSINTVKSFYRRCKDTSRETVSSYCKCCGKPIVQPAGAREKKFCSDVCRMKWWNSHREAVNKKAVYSYKCECCGRQFQAYGSKKRKYCGRVCYIRHRFGDGDE